MKKIKYIYPLFATLILGACSVEAPFKVEMGEGQGQFNKSALDLDVNQAALNFNSRAGNNEMANQFGIVFQEVSGSTPATVASFETYESMPDIVILDKGKYQVVATYGEDLPAKFENPYYRGDSEEFYINPNEITTSIDPIKCNLANVKVTINFHSSLLNHISDDSYIEVYVNPDQPLHFTKDETRAGFFKHSDVSTLTATFHGEIDGVKVAEVKTMNEINRGHHYDLTFIRHDYNNEESGDIEGRISVDATVKVTDLNRNVTILDDELLEDTERPKEEDPSGEDPGKDPQDPDEPDEPDDPNYVPGPHAEIDLERSTIDSFIAEVDDDSHVALKITSKTGLTVFKVDVESEKLDLADVNIEGGYLDLINPGANIDPLHNLGLIPEDKNSLKGETEVIFDVSKFMPMLGWLGPCEHTFIITMADQEAENVVRLVLIRNN